MKPSNLPPGVTDAMIEEAIGPHVCPVCCEEDVMECSICNRDGCPRCLNWPSYDSCLRCFYNDCMDDADSFAPFVVNLASNRSDDEPEGLVLHGMMGAVTEAGELLDAEKRRMFYGAPLDPCNILEEVGDLLHYVEYILHGIGFTSEQAKALNIAKLRVRYPNGFTKQDAVNRDKDRERRIMQDMVERMGK